MADHQLTASDTFEVVWDDPATAAQRWTLDREHNHGTLTRFEIERQTANRGAMEMESVVVNGRVYTGPPTLPAPPKELRHLHYAEMWDGTFRAEAIAPTEVILGRDHSELSDLELLAELRADLPRTQGGFRATMSPIFKLFMQMHPFSQFCRAEFGDPDGLLLQYRMLQGRETETTDAARGLERLAELAEDDDELVVALERGAAAEARANPAHAAFFSEFDGYIERYGWRASIWTDLSTPTWAEDPSVPLAMVARFVRNPETRPSIALASAAADREAAIAEAMGQLDEEKQGALQAFLAEHEPFPRVREGRAHWQLILSGSIRRPLIELGRRFVAQDKLDDAEDIRHLELDEMEALARGEIDGRSLAAEHRTRYEHWQTLAEPDVIGSGDAGPDPLERMNQPAVVERISADGKLHSGVAASAGVAYGRARVATNLSDAMLLEPGEILVCRTTAPPWTPVFALASAVVTEGGGVLAHSAIVAREYKIPAVLEIQNATTKIADGAMITVDGNRGTVRVD